MGTQMGNHSVPGLLGWVMNGLTFVFLYISSQSITSVAGFFAIAASITTILVNLNRYFKDRKK